MTQPNALPSAPFADFAPRTPLNNPLRAAITAATRGLLIDRKSVV